ncbi:winged helix-turn-helix transcriptional regulator [Candidatus Sumerlaeota bacterium]|nr:winged helix-turn-helix transcriptional regulator [Candidatus Sumerlaeota bacterium]
MKRAKQSCCGPLKAGEAHAEAFKALAHSGRLRVFFHLVREGHETPAGRVQKATKIPAPTLSHHLDLLRRAGLIRRRKQERYVLYSVNAATVSDLVRLLTACC